MKPRRDRRCAKASPRSRWGAFALGGLAAGILFSGGMRLQAYQAPTLEPVLSEVPDDGRATIWVLFQRADCVDAAWKVEGWERAAESGRLEVVGWALDEPGELISGPDPVSLLDVSFEIRRRPEPALARTLRIMGIDRTPTALLIDGNGRLRLVIPGRTLNTPDDIEEAIQHAESLLH